MTAKKAPSKPVQRRKPVPAPAYREDDLTTLARTLYGESEANNLDDARTIACVIMERTKHKQWPSTVAAVCLQPFQFSCWNPGDPNRERIMHASGAWWTKCKQIASDALGGKLTPPAPELTHYYETGIATPKWARGKVAAYEVKHKSGTAHAFYNGIDLPAPKTKTAALDQIKPIAETAPIKAAKVAGGSVATIGILDLLQQNAVPAFSFLGTLAQAAPWVIAAILGVAVLYLVWHRLDERAKGIR